jgi:hypothetical protein
MIDSGTKVSDSKSASSAAATNSLFDAERDQVCVIGCATRKNTSAFEAGVARKSGGRQGSFLERLHKSSLSALCLEIGQGTQAGSCLVP